MSSLKKYYFGFRLALANELIHRMNFLFGVLRRVIFSITIVFVFQHIPAGIGTFSSSNLVAYALVSYVISSLVHSYAMKDMAEEITSGDLTNYLVKPIGFLPFWAARMMATRVLLAMSVCIGLVAVWSVSAIPFKQLFFVAHPLQTAALFVGALTIVQLIDFLCGMVAFWTEDEHGVQWLVTTGILFCSGALMPIGILPHRVQAILNLTPFPSLVYAPVQMYLGNLDERAFVRAAIVQIAWILVGVCGVYIVWRRGTRTYEAYGR